jgi:hypothetical protein
VVQPRLGFYLLHRQCRLAWGALPWERARVAVEPQAVAVVEVARLQLPRAAAEQRVWILPWLGVARSQPSRAAEQRVRIPPWLEVVQQPLPRWAAVPLATHLLQQIQDWGLTGRAGANLPQVILPASNRWGVAIDRLQQRKPQSPRQYQLQEQALVHPLQYC